MAKQNASLTLDELYGKEKITKAVEVHIIAKSDFSKINERYCDNICKLKCKASNTVPILSTQVDILIIQDHRNPAGKYDRNPGQQDYIQSGVIDFIAKQAGLNGLNYRVTSLLKCPASKEDFPSGKPPTQTRLQKCFPYLHEEILRTKPKVILSLGTATTKALGLSKHSNSGNRGEIALSEYGPVVITQHPRVLTYIRQNASGNVWGPDYMKVIQRDFEKAAKIARGQFTYTKDTLKLAVEKLVKERITIAKNIEDIVGIVSKINALPENAVISFDTETNSLDPLSSDLKLLSIQFGWRDPGTQKIVAGVIPLWHRKNTFYNPDEAWNIVLPLLLNADRSKVGHNSKYDILVIYWSKGIRVKGVVLDTLLLMHSIESGTQGCYGLKAACWDHLYEEGYAGYENELGDLKVLQKARNKELELELSEEDESKGEYEEITEMADAL